MRLGQDISTLEKVRPLRLYETVIDSLSRWATLYRLKAGDRLPPERALETQLGVSRPVLREAFRVLETNGVIVSRQGGGRFLLRDDIPSSETLRRLHLDNSRENLFCLWEAREAVEIKAAELAAVRATAEQIADIYKPLDPLTSATPADYRDTDFNVEFHLAVSRASGNSFLQEMIRNLMDQFRQIDFKYLLPLQTWSDLQDDHRLIADAIKARNSDAARHAMRLHFDELRLSVDEKRPSK